MTRFGQIAIPEMEISTDHELDHEIQNRIKQLKAENYVQSKIKSKIQEFFDSTLKDQRCNCFRANFIQFYYEIEENDYELTRSRTDITIRLVSEMDAIGEKANSSIFYLNGMKSNHLEYKKSVDVMKNGYFLTKVHQIILTLVMALNENHLIRLSDSLPTAPTPLPWNSPSKVNDSRSKDTKKSYAEYWQNLSAILKLSHSVIDRLKPWINENPPPISNFTDQRYYTSQDESIWLFNKERFLSKAVTAWSSTVGSAGTKANKCSHEMGKSLFKKWRASKEFASELAIMREIDIFMDDNSYVRKITLLLDECYELVIKSLKYLNYVMSRTNEKERNNLYFTLSYKYLERFVETFFGSKGETSSSSLVIGSRHENFISTVEPSELEFDQYDTMRLSKASDSSPHQMSVYHYLSSNFTLGILDSFFLKNLDTNLKFESDLNLNLSFYHPLFKQNLRNELLRVYAKQLNLREASAQHLQKDKVSQIPKEMAIPLQQTSNAEDQENNQMAVEDVEKTEPQLKQQSQAGNKTLNSNFEGLSNPSVMKKIEKIAEKEKNPLYATYMIKGLVSIIKEVYGKFEQGLEFDRLLFSEAEKQGVTIVDFFIEFLEAGKRGDNQINKCTSEVYRLKFTSEFLKDGSPTPANLEMTKFVVLVYAELFTKVTNLYFQRFIHRQHWSQELQHLITDKIASEDEQLKQICQQIQEQESTGNSSLSCVTEIFLKCPGLKEHEMVKAHLQK